MQRFWCSAAIALAATPCPGLAFLLLGLAVAVFHAGRVALPHGSDVVIVVPDEIRSWCTLRTSNYVREIYYVPIAWGSQSNVMSAVFHIQVVEFIE